MISEKPIFAELQLIRDKKINVKLACFTTLLIILQSINLISNAYLIIAIPIVYFILRDLALSILLITLTLITSFHIQKDIRPIQANYFGVVTNYPVFKSDGKVIFSMDVESENFTAYVTLNSNILSNAHKLKKGERIFFSGVCKTISPAFFGFESSLYRRYDAKCNVKYLSIYKSNSPNFVTRFRNLLIEEIYKNTSRNIQADLILSMTFGIETLLSESVFELFKKTGLAHLLVVSGMHVSVLFTSLVFLFRSISKYSLIYIRKLGHFNLIEFLALLLVILYVELIGFEPAAIRALISLFLTVLGSFFGSKLNLINNIIASLLIINLFYPLIIFEPGTQLTYCTLFGIYLASFLKPSIKNYFLGSAIISASSSIVTIIWFGTFSWLSFILNPILAPAIGIITCQVALILIILNCLGISFGIEMLGTLLEYFVKFIAWIVKVT